MMDGWRGDVVKKLDGKKWRHGVEGK